jgi:hypothetical protein
LPVERARLHPPAQLLEQDALVQGVLIDDEHAVVRFDDEVGVVQLKGARVGRF